MTAQRLAMVVGAILLVAGIAGLLVPVSVSGDDGKSVGCGNALVSDMSGAQAANNQGVANVPVLNQIVPHTDYVALCESAVGSRRSWAIPVAAVGALVAVGAAVMGGRRGRAV
ncbi:aminopeptidase [Mycolicibacterium baixiangningiae]|uniref:aminopeptidase n=1 Tax=Mycolicibacterium baixiangningiae TaxID=2761578 RepID=UPI001868146C|nr:aminopeptidase [Mycolicibacterium baixiangningiae]